MVTSQYPALCQSRNCDRCPPQCAACMAPFCEHEIFPMKLWQDHRATHCTRCADRPEEHSSPVPATVEIVGFEVLERTARRQGNSAMLQVPVADIGKRFKVVRIDP